ncbi:MAG TPA: sterol desaturase family protein [Microscillaceae bacterium]|nr:sterol desaturase family protein [Microscillaceae bacterium]
MLNPTTLAIPLFFLLIGIELLINQFQKAKLYRLHDAITDINIGSSQQIVAILMRLLGIGLYEIIYHNLSFQWIDNTQFSWVNFIILFIAWDFCYYWAHRMSHEINLFWSGHVVHHQSEDYNLAVALRQSWFQAIWTAPFYLPLALVGFRPEDIVYVSGLNLIYQFWIHTEVIDKMGFLEWFMNTPSHHRVHHGRNPKYIDKNHAGVFIIWDRMFGTFQAEEERPVYGITTPINSWNPIWANFSHFQTIGEQLKEARTLKDYWMVLFGKPGWSAKLQAYIPAPQVSREGYHKFDTPVVPGINWYALFQYVLATIGTAFFMFQINDLDIATKIISCGLVIGFVWLCGGLFESKRWAFFAELVRLPLSAGLVAYLIQGHALFTIFVYTIPVLIAISWIWLWQMRRYFTA